MAAQFSSQVLATAWPSYKDLPTQKERFLATKPIYSQAVKMGLIKGVIPKELGGTSGSMTDAAIMVEEMYAVETSAAINILSTGLGLLPLIIGGSDDQKTEFLKPFLTGDGEPLASLVHSEPNGTANWLEKGGAGLQTVAWKEGSEWVISGEKVSVITIRAWILNRAYDVFVMLIFWNHIDMGNKQLRMGRSRCRRSMRGL